MRGGTGSRRRALAKIVSSTCVSAALHRLQRSKHMEGGIVVNIVHIYKLFRMHIEHISAIVARACSQKLLCKHALSLANTALIYNNCCHTRNEYS